MTMLLEIDGKTEVRCELIAEARSIATSTDEYRCPRCDSLIPRASMRRRPAASPAISSNGFALEIYCAHCNAGFSADCGYQDGRVVQYGPHCLIMGDSLKGLQHHIGLIAGDVDASDPGSAQAKHSERVCADLTEIRRRLVGARAHVISLEETEKRVLASNGANPKVSLISLEETEKRVLASNGANPKVSRLPMLDALKFASIMLDEGWNESDLTELERAVNAIIEEVEPDWNGVLPEQFGAAYRRARTAVPRSISQVEPPQAIHTDNEAAYKAAAFKQQVSAGTYETEERIDVAVDRLLDGDLRDPAPSPAGTGGVTRRRSTARRRPARQ
jgi:hypothetical protein